VAARRPRNDARFRLWQEDATDGSGTEDMHRLYQTVGAREMEDAIGKVIDLARFRDAMAAGDQRPAGGEKSGGKRQQSARKEKTPGRIRAF